MAILVYMTLGCPVCAAGATERGAEFSWMLALAGLPLCVGVFLAWWIRHEQQR